MQWLLREMKTGGARVNRINHFLCNRWHYHIYIISVINTLDSSFFRLDDVRLDPMQAK
jgi:hypothetical protein